MGLEFVGMLPIPIRAAPRTRSFNRELSRTANREKTNEIVSRYSFFFLAFCPTSIVQSVLTLEMVNIRFSHVRSWIRRLKIVLSQFSQNACTHTHTYTCISGLSVHSICFSHPKNNHLLPYTVVSGGCSGT